MSTTRRSWLTAMWVAASGLAVLVLGCKKGDIEAADKYGGPSVPPDGTTPAPQPPKYGGPPAPGPAAPPTSLESSWYAVAASARSRGLEALENVLRQLSALDAARATEVVAVLDAMAAKPPTPDGLEQASKLGHDARLNADPVWTGSGMAPNVAALHAGGMAVLLGLVARGCEAANQAGRSKDGDTELVKTFRRMPLPREYNSAGLTDGKADRRLLMQEVQKHLDDSTWTKVLLEARTWPSVPNPP